MTILSHQIVELASDPESAFAGVQTHMQEFSSGAVMLDVHRADGRMFVMSYSPTYGFGVDEARPEDGFATDYRYTCVEFCRAAQRLRQLVEG